MQTLVTMGFLGIALAAMSLLPGGWSSSPFRESKVARDSQEMPEVIDIPVAADIRTLQQILENDRKKNEDEGEGVLLVQVDAQARELGLSDKAIAEKSYEDTNSNNLRSKKLQGTYSAVTSKDLFRVTLSESSKLHGAPNEKVQIKFHLTNVGPGMHFSVLARESQTLSVPEGSDDAVRFPTPSTDHFLEALSEIKPFVDANETRHVILTLKVPSNAPTGTRNVITLEVQPHGRNGAGSNETFIVRFYFTVSSIDPSTLDRIPPTCNLTFNNYKDQCTGFTQPGLCREKKWLARYILQDSGSGLRSISERLTVPRDRWTYFFSHDNFIIGDNKYTVNLVYADFCCTTNSVGNANEVVFYARDVAGGETACPNATGLQSGGPQAESQVSLATLTIVIIVAMALLLFVVAVAIVIVWVIKRKRNAELREMRETPQAR